MKTFTDSTRHTAAKLVSVTLLFALLALPLRLNAEEGAAGIENTDPASTEAYWTPERLQNVEPMPLPAVSGVPEGTAPESPPAVSVSAPGAPPTVQVQPDNTQLFIPLNREDESVEPEGYGPDGTLRFTSSRLVGNAPAALGAEKDYPYRMTGQLTFTIPSGTTCEKPGNYVCSATVQRPGIITTAGHCVSDGAGHFYNSWVFGPATRNGTYPFGKWAWKYAEVTGTWFHGGCSVPNAQDVAVLVLNKNSNGTLIGSETGYAAFNIPDLYSGQHVSAIGYPCNLDNCSIDHRTDAQVNGGSNNTDVIGADAGGGSSGGGWIINYGEYASGQPVAGESDANRNSLVAVTSYGPTDTFGYLGASILNSGYVQCTPLATCSSSPSAILNIVCKKFPGYC
jgi:V8-like Glu-specific endopeptidase